MTDRHNIGCPHMAVEWPARIAAAVVLLLLGAGLWHLALALPALIGVQP